MTVWIDQGTLIAALEFIEGTHIVEILREAGPEGLGVEEIATKVAELRRGANPDAASIDSSYISASLYRLQSGL